MNNLSLAVVVFLLCDSIALAQNAAVDWSQAAWVWDEADADKEPQSDQPRYLRREFHLNDAPLKARLAITADNHYTVYVNGHRVGADDEWNTVEDYDVVKHLKKGKNVLAILARNAGGPAGVIGRLHVVMVGGKSLVVGTDARTRITRVADKDWLRVEFDDARWPAAVVLGPASMGPWNLVAVASGSGNQVNVSAVDPAIKSPLSPDQQKRTFVFPEGFELELVAAEPLVINPVTMIVDEQGRIYVSESHTYRYGPSGSPVKPFANPVVRLDPQPDGKGYTRTLVADGFDDPVMGMAIKGDKLWLTANNFLYLYDLTAQGKAINKRTLLVDKNKAWNPFGMFVLEWGLDGWLYMSVGNHAIDIHGPDGKITGRGSSGIILRMKPDGSSMERLVHGLRVPYSFEYDPFGQLWVLSNGEGNPDRFVRVLDGVDYHCYSRNVDNSWLAGEHPLAPPCFQNMRGAHTQLVRYYGAAYPESYQGNLFLDNWGAHGFAGPNRAIFRFVPDARGNIVTRESFLSCKDPHFRPSHIVLDPDGNLLIADWYGRDDESDKTGRIWRLKHTGKDRPKATHRTDDSLESMVSAFGSPSHLIRDKAMQELIRRGNKAVVRLKDEASSGKEALGSAHALWTLLRIDSADSRSAIAAGAKHPDWKVRRLAINLLRRFQMASAAEVARTLGKDADPAVRVEAALARGQSVDIRTALIDALIHGAARDAHLRYEAAWHLAKHADAEAISRLLSSEEEDVRLAGLIAIDVACYEVLPSKKIALAELGKALESPGKIDPGLLLTLAKLDGDASIVPSLEKLVAREDIPAAVTAKALLVLKSKGGSSPKIEAAAGKRLLVAVEKGALRLTAPEEHLIFLEFLESEGATDFALKHVTGQILSGHPSVRQAAHTLTRKFGPKSAAVAQALWPRVLDPRANKQDAIELLATLAYTDQRSKSSWEKLLTQPDPLLRTEAVRWWRNFKGQPEMVEALTGHAPALVQQDPGLKEDLAVVFRHLEAMPDVVKGMELEKDKTALAKHTVSALDALKPADRQTHALLGRQVFDRAGCVKCHTTVLQNTLLAPSLKGIAAQKVDYLIESVLYPSKIIKTGFETETVVTRNGKSISGLVKDEGKFIRVLHLDHDIRISKTDIEERAVQKISIMPEGQETQLSRREFVDLIAYLMTLK